MKILDKIILISLSCILTANFIGQCKSLLIPEALLDLPAHSNNIFVVNTTKKEFSLPSFNLEMAKEFQFCILNSTEMKNIYMDSYPIHTIFHIMSRFSNLKEYTRLKVRGTTWIFYPDTIFSSELEATTGINDDVYLLDPNESEVYKVYQIKKSTLHIKLEKHSQVSKLRLTRDMNKAIIEVALVLLDSQNSTRKDSPIISSGQELLSNTKYGVDDNDRISFHLLAYMQDFLNFSVRFHEANAWVYSPTNTSMTNLLLEQNLDLAISNTGLWVSLDFRFLFVTKVFRDVYVYYHLPESSNAKDFANAIAKEVWFSLAIYVFVLFILAIFIFEANRKFYLLLWSLGVMTKSGIPVPEIRYDFTAKYVILFSSFVTLLFHVSLSAFLVSSFSVVDEIRTLQNLINRKYSFGVPENSVLHNTLKNGWLTEDSFLWNMRSFYTVFSSEVQGAAEVARNNKFAFISHHEFFTIYPKEMAKIEVCGIMNVLTLQGDRRWGSAFVRKDSPFADHFNFARIRMFETGITNRILVSSRRTADMDKPNCISSSTFKFSQKWIRGISYEELFILFWIFYCGLASSVLVLLVEIYVNHIGTKNINIT